MSYYVLSFDGSASGPRVEGTKLAETEAKRLFEKVAFFTKCFQGDDTTRLGYNGKSVELCEHLKGSR